MKRLLCSLPAKIFAVCLSLVLTAAFAVSAVGVVYMVYRDYYVYDKQPLLVREMENSVHYQLWEVYDLYCSTGDDLPHIYRDRNFYFEIADGKTGEIVLSNYEGQKTICSVTQEYSESLVDYWDEENQEQHIMHPPLTITLHISEKMEHNDIFALQKWLVDFAHPLRYAAIWIGVSSLVVLIALLSFLYAAAGHRKGSDVAVCNLIDKIPFDIYGGVMFLAFMANVLIVDGFYRDIDLIPVMILLGVADLLLLLSFTMSFATRIKTGTLIKNTLIYYILRFGGKYLLKIGRGIGYLFGNLPLIWKTALITVGICFIEFIIILSCAYYIEAMIGWWFVSLMIFVPWIMYIAITLAKLKKGGERIASGDLEYKIDTKYMFGDFKDFGERLNHINDGLQSAVEARMKSERFKTELITNVSHDIKTPLTSIINYVDLIKKKNPKDKETKEYIEVLDRQSSRLKKLIEDLVEASKASTGSLAVNFENCEAGVLLSQAAGEFDQRFHSAEIEPVLTLPEQPLRISADGRHLWRVFDNLMNNICKYAQPGTRAYLELKGQGNKAVITFRNISKYPLNISGEELMERFVRGDTARHTEGSGLGLSIARSLTELQKGHLDIFVDGDLFKVILIFDLIG